MKGIAFLRAQQQSDGYWEYSGHHVGITALCALALVENGVPVTDAQIQKALSFVKDNIKDERNTYDIALSILLLARIDETAHRREIRDLAAKLICGQTTFGGWTYTCPKVNALALSNKRLRPAPKVHPGDNSCTQFAVLGLWTASRVGVDISDTMALVARRFLETQTEDGGWPYRPATMEGETATSTPSMTCAGLFCLTVARAAKLLKLLRSPDEESEETASATASTEALTEGQKLLRDPVFSKGLERVGQFVQGRITDRYTLWSIERLGVMLNLPTIGGVDWFAKGAEALLAAQQPDGSWVHPNPDRGALADTSFALLFLRRANLGSDISRLMEGAIEDPFRLANVPGIPAFKTLQEAVEAAEPGTVISVHGDGPFAVPHLQVDHDLTIRAAPGYWPVFRYEIGFDKRGLRARPDRDPDVRFLFSVPKGTLILEGVKIELEPPETRNPVDWSAIRLTGGNVRMLNVTVTERGRKDTALFALRKAGGIHLRNCLLAGGRRLFLITPHGRQAIRAENSLLYSDVVFQTTFAAGDSKPQELTITLNRATIHAPEVFDLRRYLADVKISAERCVFKCEKLGMYMLLQPNSREKRHWTGDHNLFGVYFWIGGQGRPTTSVKDLKSWSAFWGGTDEHSHARAVGFVISRPYKAYSHRVKARDWELDPRTGFRSDRYGIQPAIVGAGRAYVRVRDSFDYREWLEEIRAKQIARLNPTAP
ncbi:MAG: hypothetical protein D6725_13880 [Planctomycetota bacterium]|nr:MAG: hypothetical protein D6725_13880 [Planctomycetota bacterium]